MSSVRNGPIVVTTCVGPEGLKNVEDDLSEPAGKEVRGKVSGKIVLLGQE